MRSIFFSVVIFYVITCLVAGGLPECFAEASVTVSSIKDEGTAARITPKKATGNISEEVGLGFGEKAVLAPLIDYAVNKRISTLLSRARRDLEAFRLFMVHFNKRGDLDALGMVGEPLIDFLDNYVDHLLEDSNRISNFDVLSIVAEMLYLKAQLLFYLGEHSDAGNVINLLRTRYSVYMKVYINLPEKSMTIEESIGRIDAQISAAMKNAAVR